MTQTSAVGAGARPGLHAAGHCAIYANRSLAVTAHMVARDRPGRAPAYMLPANPKSEIYPSLSHAIGNFFSA